MVLTSNWMNMFPSLLEYQMQQNRPTFDEAFSSVNSVMPKIQDWLKYTYPITSGRQGKTVASNQGNILASLFPSLIGSAMQSKGSGSGSGAGGIMDMLNSLMGMNRQDEEYNRQMQDWYELTHKPHVGGNIFMQGPSPGSTGSIAGLDNLNENAPTSMHNSWAQQDYNNNQANYFETLGNQGWLFNEQKDYKNPKKKKKEQ